MGGLFGGGGSNTHTKETPASGVQFQSSSNGVPIAIPFGKTRLSPNLIWYGDFTAVPHTTTQSSGGKGGGDGGSSSYTTYTYTASFCLALGEGPINSVPRSWIGKDAATITTDLFTVFDGSYAQMPWGYLSGAHPEEALGYRGIAYAATSAYDLGSSANLPNHNFEVIGFYPLNIAEGVFDVDPKDIVVGLLTNEHWGVPGFPSSLIGNLSSYSNYCRASGLLFSPAYTDQQSASQMITDLMQISNSGIYFSEGLLKITPYGDAEVTGNGVTYVPSLTPVGYPGDDDYLPNDGDDPVVVRRNSIPATSETTSDAFNQVQVEFVNRNNAYQVEVMPAQDLASIDTYGLRPMSIISAHQIAEPTVAQAVSQLILQRSVYVRNQFEFRLGWAWCFLEPTDILAITDSVLGLSNYPVRVLSIEEDESGTLFIVAEDAPPGASSHVVAPVPASGGYSADYNADPGDIAPPVFFEPPIELTSGGSGLEVWAGVSGLSTLWGGSNVWVSYDGDSYKLAGRVDNPSRIGYLTAPLGPTGTGPLSIELDGLGGQILSGTAGEAAKLATMIYVGGESPEFMAYQGATLTGPNAYSLDGLVRGVHGSAESDHETGAPFVRIDEAVFRSGGIDLSMIGQVVYFKFQSFNIWGGGVQDLGSLAEYAYTISGLAATGNPVTGLTAIAVPGSASLMSLTWDESPGADRYIIDQSGDGITWIRTCETKSTNWADSALFGAATRFRVAAVRAKAGSWSSTVFISISFVAMWSANPATPMWSANPATPMWSS